MDWALCTLRYDLGHREAETSAINKRVWQIQLFNQQEYFSFTSLLLYVVNPESAFRMLYAYLVWFDNWPSQIVTLKRLPEKSGQAAGDKNEN
jgi:hypothetical protein